MSARTGPGRHRRRGPSDDGRTAGLVLLAANVLGASLVVAQAQTARAIPPAVQLDQSPTGTATLNRPDPHTDRTGGRPPLHPR